MKRMIHTCLAFVAFSAFTGAAEAQDLDFRNDYYFGRRAEQEKTAIPPRATVMFGNSLTERGDWAAWFPGVKVVNRGIGGDILAGMADRLQPIADAKPARMFVMAGINNILFSKITPEQFRAQYAALLDKIRKGTPKTKVYIQSLLPVNEAVGGEQSAWFLKDRNPRIREFNEVVRALAGERGLVFIDLYPLLEKDGELNAAYTVDGVHLNPEGYKVWVSALGKYMEKR